MTATPPQKQTDPPEDRYRALLEATSGVVWSAMPGNLDAQLDNAQRWWAELTGQTLDEQRASERAWLDAVHPDDRAKAEESWRTAIGNGSVYESEFRVTARDGGWRFVYVRGVPLHAPDGRVREWFGTMDDVTERRQAESELQRSEQRHRALVTAAADVVYSMNADWSEMRPLDGHGVVAGNDAPLRGWMHKNLPPHEHGRVRAAIEHAIAGKTLFELEHEIVRADGTPGWVLSRAAPVLDGAGRVIEWFGTARDITEQKRSHLALSAVTDESARRKRLYETILSNTPDFAYVFDLDHRFVYANETLLRMWGKTWDEAIGRTCHELGYPEWHASMHDREIEQVKSTRAPVRGEVPFDGAFGRRIYEYIFVPVIGADGEVEAVAGTTRDVTDRNAMEQKLRESDRKKDDFIALLAHELRNPLAPIRNGLQILHVAAPDDAAVTAARAVMERQLAHMVRLIDDLLDVSRITRDKLELRRACVTLDEVVAHAVESVTPAVHQAGHELTVELPPEPITLEADTTRLAQVFANLLNNSAKYTPAPGRVSVRAEAADGWVTVRVRDNGIGIPPGSLESVFDMFSQIDRDAERHGGGLGIGLALVRGLVQMHGGSVHAESPAEGGSVFVVRLPTADPAPGPQDAPAQPAARAAARRVLVVDDNTDSAESMAALLGMMGHEVAMAHDGLGAVDAAASFRPALILMDIGLPGISGLEATERIRAQPWGREPTIVALTGWGQDSDRRRSREAGCDAHLVKPVEFDALERLLRDHASAEG